MDGDGRVLCGAAWLAELGAGRGARGVGLGITQVSGGLKHRCSVPLLNKSLTLSLARAGLAS